MNKKIIKIIISGLVFSIGFFIKTDIEWIKIALFIISYLIIGFEVLKDAIKNIIKGDFFDENFLMSIATIGAIAIKEYPEAVAVMIFYQIGELFEDIATEKSKKSITKLMSIRPDFANVKEADGNIIKKKTEEVNIGEIIVVKPGEKIPLDGEIIEGNTTVDESILTGESMPIEKEIKDNVFSGCINLSSSVSIRVNKNFEQSSVCKILELVQNANNKKSVTESFITKFSKVYTPVVVGLAVLLAIVPSLILKIGEPFEWIYRALTFLVISCPCALVISVPLSFFGGIGGASKRGILIKGSNYIDLIAKIDTVVFDKTGTLTEGIFEVQEVIPEGIIKEELIKYVAYAESYSNHPIAISIRKLYEQTNEETIDLNKVSDIKEIPGKGIKCKVNGKDVIVGNLKFLEKEGYIPKKDNEDNISSMDLKKTTIMKLQDEEKDGKIGTILYVLIDKNYVGKLIIADKIKEDSKKAIKDLKKNGIKEIAMLTGDKKEVADKISKELDIEKCYSELSPEDKLEKVEELLNYNFKNDLGTLAYVGDGINDSPVLARSDIGIAMGAIGADVAIEVADVVIMTDEPSKIVKTIKIAKKTIRIARQNITFAIAIKILILILSMCNLATMWFAVFADVGVTIIAVLNSFRAMNTKNI